MAGHASIILIEAL